MYKLYVQYSVTNEIDSYRLMIRDIFCSFLRLFLEAWQMCEKSENMSRMPICYILIRMVLDFFDKSDMFWSLSKSDMSWSFGKSYESSADNNAIHWLSCSACGNFKDWVYIKTMNFMRNIFINFQRQPFSYAIH
jgi:hypothetical protein